MSASWATFLFEAANFLLLAAVLGWLFFRPVRDALERRRSALEAEQRAAAEARAAAEQGLHDAQGRQAELEASFQGQRERARREAETERERLLASARAQIERERETLKAERLAHRREQARGLAGDAAFAAREVVEQLLGHLDGPELDPVLVRAACRELEALRAAGPLSPVVFESARPLDEAALGELARAAGVEAAEAEHRVDPGLVAGLRAITARGLVDLSASGMAAQAERALLQRLEPDDGTHPPPRDGSRSESRDGSRSESRDGSRSESRDGSRREPDDRSRPEPDDGTHPAPDDGSHD